MVKGSYFESMRAYEKQEDWENGSGSFSLIEFCKPWASLVGGNFSWIWYQVMAQRRPILHRVLDHSDEAYSLLMLLLELHSLRTAGMLASYLFHCLHECLVLAELAYCDEPWILLVHAELASCHKPQICGWFQMHHLQTPLFFIAKLAHVINPEFCGFLGTGIIW